MGDNSPRKIILQDDQEIIELLGENDQNIKLIEDTFSAKIIARGNELTIDSDTGDAGIVEDLLSEILLALRKGNPVSPSEIKYAIKMIKKDRNVALSSVFSHRIYVSPKNGGVIRPKTVGQKKYVEAMEDLDMVFCIGPAGTGKCIAGSSLVLTTQGLLPIESITPGVKSGSYVPIDLDVSGIQGVEKAGHLYCGGVSLTKRIRTRLGYEIEATAEHPLMHLNAEGVSRWRRADELRVGDYVAIQRGQNLFGSKTDIDFHYPPDGPQDHAKPLGLHKLDEDIACFMGILTGAGCLISSDRVILRGADGPIVTFFYRMAARFGLHVFRNSRGKPHDYIISSPPLYQLLFHLGMSDGSLNEKQVPQSILSAPREIVTAFLRGLFYTDARVRGQGGCLSFSSGSKRLIDQVQIILLNFDILANKRPKQTIYRGEYRLSYQLEINGADAKRFYQKVGFGLLRKQELRRARGPNPNIDPFPHLPELIQRDIVARTFPGPGHERLPIYAKVGETVGVLPEAGAPCPSVPAERGAGVAGTEERNPFGSMLEEVPDGNLFWEEIIEIEDGEADVYDLTVPGTHSFCANGFVNHNTYLAVAMAVAALKNKEVDRIILTRPALEAGEQLGFLPGDIYDKVAPYLRPLYDALFDIMKENSETLIAKGTVEIAPLAYMRGRTLNRSFIILDEAQNTTVEQMKMFLTRLGFNSKVVITGDVTQVDLPSDRSSGLIQIQSVLSGIDEIRFIYLEKSDIVRHPLVQSIIQAYEEFEERNKVSP